MKVKSTKKHFIVKAIGVCLLLILQFSALAGEGMWMPPLLAKRAADMKSKGLKMDPEKIFKNDGTGLNNAIVLFGSGCTGEIVSNKGLLLTNHHCGYGTVQGLSGPTHDFFKQGFWAMSFTEELPCPGLKVRIVQDMKNVTDHILSGLTEKTSQHERERIIKIRIANLEKGYKTTTPYDVEIKPFYNGNQYWITLFETFTDVRLVGFPPNGIGAFGGDTDNWMWPRHGGDFSVFRIYAGANNQPADYSPSNKPYVPKNFLKINTDGVKEGDFTMVYGFPGRTKEYISSYELEQITDIYDPISVDVRTAKLKVWDKYMRNDRNVFLKYTSKKARVSNGWKKWQGEMKGLKINNVKGQKKSFEMSFAEKAQKDTASGAGQILPQLYANTVVMKDMLKANQYINEAIMGIELVSFSSIIQQVLQNKSSQLSAEEKQNNTKKFISRAAGFYKNFDLEIDKELFTVLMPIYIKNNSGFIPDDFIKSLAQHKGDYKKWAEEVYNNSMLKDDKSFTNMVLQSATTPQEVFEADPAFKIYKAISDLRTKTIRPALANGAEQMKLLNRRYMKAQMDFYPNKAFYPDANLTLRLAYGQVKGIDPEGEPGYSYLTNLDEAVAKHNPDLQEFDMPEKLRKIHESKAYGRWESNGTVPICFIATNHTTGGNSGSPVLNANGELIGLNFDRIWEGTMSDIYFDPNLCRNISVDIRYVLFIIDKVGGANWLIKEMKI